MQPNLVVGAIFHGKVRMRDDWLIEEDFEVQIVDRPHAIAWRGLLFPRWALVSVRHQTLTALSPTQTRYETWETFKGPLGLAVMLQAKPIQRGFDSVCAALKTHAESRA